MEKVGVDGRTNSHYLLYPINKFCYMGPNGPHTNSHHTTFSESDPPAISECGSPLYYFISDFYLTSLEPANKQGSRLKRSTAKMSSPRHDGEVSQY